jgi:hypothetical protein
MDDRQRRVAAAVASALVLVLSACSTTTKGNYRKDAAHETLLETLRQCLVEVPIRGDKNKDFISPCISMDVSSLSGIPRSKLIDALGPARYCTGQTETQPSGFPTKEDCPVDQNPQWSFYRSAHAIASSGGPELVCEAKRQTYCNTVEWRRSQ